MSDRENSVSVEEFQGYYGPYQASEILLQKIWLKSAFDIRGLKDQWGREVNVEFAGQWNRLDGPDFKRARLTIDGEFIEGDVEVHFRHGDWTAHGHDRDSGYDEVVLHVVLFPVKSIAHPTLTSRGVVVPTVSLIHLLWYDLEEYATEDSIISSTGVDQTPFVEELLGFPLKTRVEILKERARERWKLKKHFAKLRVEQLGWTKACHMSALEAMGYGRNRVPMLLVASRYSIEAFHQDEVELEELWQAGEGKWRLRGTRPANHPRLRLSQYLAWAKYRPCWPERLVDLAKELPTDFSGDEDGKTFRRYSRMTALRKRLSDFVMADQLSGSKLNTLFCDALLPLLAARLDGDYFPLWFHWYAGNAPDSSAADLKTLEVAGRGVGPTANGWIQGVLRLNG